MSEKHITSPLNYSDATPGSGDAGTQEPASRFESFLVNQLLKAIGRPPVSIELWDGSSYYLGTGKPLGTVRIASRPALRRLVLTQDVGFGDGYSSGEIEVDGDLVDMLVALYHSSRSARGRGGLDRVAGLLNRRPRLNTMEGSRDNIHHHYDLGNRFYRIWLDEEMQYTCAYFPDPSMTIEQAQQAKMELVCRKLQLAPGDTVVEAGCGWGSLARHMALHHGVTVKAYNISNEQVQFARDRARREGYDDRVTYELEDYRNIRGTFDKFVSVGMLEHVGTANYEHLGQVVARCLANGGRGLIHTIGRNRPQNMNAWIEKRIFPGAYPPTIKEMMNIFQSGNLSVLDIENLRLHYAATLERWLDRYEANRDTVADMFNAQFIRAWRLYLCGSIAAFKAGYLQLFQVVFAHAGDNTVPMTREHLYR